MRRTQEEEADAPNAPAGAKAGVAVPRAKAIATALVAFQGLLLAHGVTRNSITIDEVVHLPAGISYWHHGTFWCYHHNPPLVRLLFSLPAVLMDVPTDYRNYRYVEGTRSPDCDLGRDFMLLNQKHYLTLFAISRSVVVLIAMLGGYFVFRWSRELFGDAGGLLSLFLWTFCPNILAHAGLVTPDVGATVITLIACYVFWRYLKAPSLRGAILSGIGLGLSEASKFSLVILPAAWAAIAAVKVWADRRNPSTAAMGPRLALKHGAVVGLVALIALNDVYLGEGAFRPLGSFELRSRTLTVERPTGDPEHHPGHARENRFRGTILAAIPVPLPEHYLMGFDDQAFDIDSGNYYKYLEGELRHEEGGWWYYYLFCFLVKTPLGTLAILAATVVAAASRGSRRDRLAECSLALPAIAVVALVSSQTKMNSHLRYILPALPFLFISAGRLGALLAAGPMAGRACLALAMLATAASTLSVHPDYLTYFHEAAGGPDHGLDHLADSNIDWGQGLIALKRWVDRNAPGRKIRLAYFGTMYPEVFGFDYEIPNFGPRAPDASEFAPRVDPDKLGPQPGLQAVSANYLLGIPFPAPNAMGSQSNVPRDAYTYFRRLRPVAIAGHSIFIYDISRAEANRVRGELGLPPLAGVAAQETIRDGHVDHRQAR